MNPPYFGPSDREARERWLAHWVGSAAGHLFALAELNYDLTYGKTTQPSETTESTMLEESKPRRTLGFWLAVVILALAAIVVLVWPAKAMEAISPVERAIVWLCRGHPGHPVNRDPYWRAELARLIEEKAHAYDVPELLWTAIVFRESSFRIHARGALGEVGLVQVHGRAAHGCELDSPSGQLECGLRWFALARERCGGDLQRGFTLYASGRVCNPDTNALRMVVRSRWELWRKLQRVTGGAVPTPSGPAAAAAGGIPSPGGASSGGAAAPSLDTPKGSKESIR